MNNFIYISLHLILLLNGCQNNLKNDTIEINNSCLLQVDSLINFVIKNRITIDSLSKKFILFSSAGEPYLNRYSWDDYVRILESSNCFHPSFLASETNSAELSIAQAKAHKINFKIGFSLDISILIPDDAVTGYAKAVAVNDTIVAISDNKSQYTYKYICECERGFFLIKKIE